MFVFMLYKNIINNEKKIKEYSIPDGAPGTEVSGFGDSPRIGAPTEHPIS